MNMGLKEFKTDLAKAESATFDKVLSLHKGDAEGELTFSYVPDNSSNPIQIQVLVQNVVSYPKRPDYFLYVSSDGVDRDICNFLSSLPQYINARSTQSVADVVSFISKRLTARLDPMAAAEEAMSPDEQDTPSDDGSEVDDFSVCGDFNWSGADDEEPFFETRLGQQGPRQFGLPEMIFSGAVERQRKELLAAKKAGFSVGVFDSSISQLGPISSLSVPVKRLGITDFILEAWDIKPTDHLVLLMRVPEGYPTHDHYFTWSGQQPLIQFQLGKCAEPKPSAKSCREAFMSSDVQDQTRQGEKEDQSRQFLPLYLFNFIPKLLEKDLPQLLKIRRKTRGSWIDAQEKLYDLANADYLCAPSGSSGNHQSQGNGHNKAKTKTVHNVPWILRQDGGLDPDEDMSIPLVAMQCSLQLLVRSGTYCVNCHHQMEEGFQTIRPYVCSRDLCLEHYFSLDLGPGIEHEVINNPYVVDLLVSFFYVAVSSHKLRDFPRGLRLKAPKFDISRPLNAEISFYQCKAVWGQNVPMFLPEGPVRVGERLLLVKGALSDAILSESLWSHWDSVDKFLCYVVSSTVDGFTFEILTTPEIFQNANGPQPTGNSTTATDINQGWMNMRVIRYSGDLDDLEPANRNKALRIIVSGIPSVLRMRKHLLDNVGSRLSRSSQILDQYTYRLLFWIVASNRSFIVQDGPVKRSSHGVGAADGQATSPVQDHVLGMEDDWMQFRFVQGSPEKERRFSEAVKLVPERDSQKAFPTIFAWHGSSLGNWHGIVSTGLNFDRVDNGRASGNGVYFSNYASTSLGYAAMAHNSIIWPHSELRVANAISMCEIVNQPDKFVSSSPHYVVDNLDWIQCRLLFIRVAPTMDALDEPFPQPPPRPRGGYVPQDPQRALFGSRGRRLEIPWSAVAGGWSQVATGNFTKGTDGNRRRPSTLMGQESEESEFEGIDIDKILSEDPQYDLKRQRLSDSPSGFRPGTLDWDTLPRLPDPTSASSTALRALAREAKEMTKIQNSGDLTSLGWYIDFDKLTNLLHWIVELHSFDQELPLVQDMKKKSCQSVVLELRFGQGYPMSPPFARVIRPRFLSFAHGGGGHVTAGGAICSELLTNTGWSPALSLEKVLLQVRLGLCDTERPARLDLVSSSSSSDYGVLEAAEAYKRAAAAHGWSIPGDFDGVIRDMMK